MRLFHIAVLMVPSLFVAGCHRPASSAKTQVVERTLTVWGPADGVRRFAMLQGSRRPALPVSAVTSMGGGKAQAKVDLPADFSGQDLIHTTREALAADLSYRFDDRRSTKIVRKS